METIKRIHLRETDSTNSFLHNYKGSEGELFTIATTDFQSAGRGQGGNSWESRRGKNLLMSVKTKPQNVSAAEQYILLEAAALAVRDAVERFAGCRTTIKWPNDIYCGDRKISGTLSECSIARGTVRECVLGIGVNINQEVFLSDAPNPVSIKNITGHYCDTEAVLNCIIDGLRQYIGMVNGGLYNDIATRYATHLYRSTGFHEYEDKDGRFMAEIKEVRGNGYLRLMLHGGEVREYAFKEVKFII